MVEAKIKALRDELDSIIIIIMYFPHRRYQTVSLMRR